MGQVLLLSAGFLVLVAISAASVLFVNKAREDSVWVVHTIQVENQTHAAARDPARGKQRPGLSPDERARVSQRSRGRGREGHARA
jgi:hypothetical protein